MCIATTCSTCGKQTWKGCGLHIEAALSNVTLEARCKGWETGKCPGVEESKEDGPLSCKNIERKLREGFEGIEFFRFLPSLCSLGRTLGKIPEKQIGKS